VLIAPPGKYGTALDLSRTAGERNFGLINIVNGGVEARPLSLFNLLKNILNIN
jgi:hypothetical protein